MNINIELPEELHKRLKIACAMKGISIKDFIIESMDSSEKKPSEKQGDG